MKTSEKLKNYKVDDRGCWVWQGYADRNGYGRIYDNSLPRRARTDWVHRVSYRATNGPIPEKHEIDHTCQNTLCMNPAHLEAVTRPEHVRRTYERLGKDARHHLAAVLRSSGMTYREIAEALEYSGKGGASSAISAAISKGLIDPAEVPPARKLTREEREDIRDLYALGVPQTEIAAWYELHSSQVSRICNGMTSGHGYEEAA